MKKRILTGSLVVILIAALVAWGFNGYLPGTKAQKLPPNTKNETPFFANYRTGIWVRPNCYIFPTALGGVAYVELSGNYAENIEMALNGLIGFAGLALELPLLIAGTTTKSKSKSIVYFMLALLPTFLLSTLLAPLEAKMQIRASRLGRNKAIKEQLNDVNNFVSYTPEQIKKATKIVEENSENNTTKKLENNYRPGSIKFIQTEVKNQSKEKTDLDPNSNQSFKESSDALFDSRFLSVKGCKDIVEKITDDVYGKFLPSITKVLLYKKKPVGFCFANLTNDKIANVPIVAISKKHRNYGFGKILLKQLVDNLLTTSIASGWTLKELNASCDSDNESAVNMYTSIGFTEEYTYPQAYHPKTV